jgi:hypothetical protein
MLATIQFSISSYPRSLTLRKVNKLRMSEKRVLRRIFGHKREEVAGDEEN